MSSLPKRPAAPEKKRKAKPKYYAMDEDICGIRSAGFELVNAARLLKDAKGLGPAISWPDGYAVFPRHPFRFPDYLETPLV
jgi:hypothetical protein